MSNIGEGGSELVRETVKELGSAIGSKANRSSSSKTIQLTLELESPIAFALGDCLVDPPNRDRNRGPTGGQETGVGRWRRRIVPALVLSLAQALQ